MHRTTVSLSLAVALAALPTLALAQSNTPRTSTPSPAAPGSTRPTTSEPYTPLAPNARVMFSLQDAELPDAIRAIAQLTGRRFVLSGRIRAARLTIYSPTPVTADEAYEAFLLALESNGLTVVTRGAHNVIIETSDAPRSSLPVVRDNDPAPPALTFVTRVHRLRYLRPSDALALLQELRSRDGTITAHDATRSVVLNDVGDRVQRMLAVLDTVDTPDATRTPSAPTRSVRVPTAVNGRP